MSRGSASPDRKTPLRWGDRLSALEQDLPMSCKRTGVLFLGAVTLLLVCSASHAVITALLPLKSLLPDNSFIFLAKVEQLFPDKPAMVLSVAEDLKGKLPFRKLPINLTATTKDAKDGKHVPVLLKRLARDVPLIVFVKQRDEETFNAF